ncbi:MAG TPA: tRNA 2-thiouridine(34) synthase MnmA, partial [Bacteroidota bacterium]|nr:tRNA 2-thiouridine(34) synthase MnmA [Bacteroidota bacterium]
NLDEPQLFEVKIRYNGKSSMAYCNTTPEGKLKVEFLEPKAAITPGQSVVMYENDDLVGGAIIEKAID